MQICFITFKRAWCEIQILNITTTKFPPVVLTNMYTSLYYKRYFLMIAAVYAFFRCRKALNFMDLWKHHNNANYLHYTRHFLSASKFLKFTTKFQQITSKGSIRVPLFENRPASILTKTQFNFKKGNEFFVNVYFP